MSDSLVLCGIKRVIDVEILFQTKLIERGDSSHSRQEESEGSDLKIIFWFIRNLWQNDVAAVLLVIEVVVMDH